MNDISLAGKRRTGFSRVFFNMITFRDKSAYYWVMLALPLAFFICFKLYPCVGLVLAFRRFSPTGNFLGSHWVGFRYFEQAFSDPQFWRALKNNLLLGFWNDVITYPLPIIFALMLNELYSSKFSRIIQTISYLPRFLSTVIVAGLIFQILSPSVGIVNNVLASMGLEKVNFMLEAGWFRPVFIMSGVWQWTGWSAIIFLAAIASVDIQLFESANIDGAGRLKQIFYITIPCILPIIVITLILRIGSFINIGYEKVLLLANPRTYETADIISTYVYRIGIEQGSFSAATAIGLTESAVSTVLLVMANFLSRRVSENSLW